MAVYVIGGGLAGCEAAYQLAKRNIQVCLVEMKPEKYTPAHHNQDLGELVCSNSLKSEDPETGSGLLKAEMRALGSLLIACAESTKVPAGGALAVDREAFSALVTKRIESMPQIQRISAEIHTLREIAERSDCQGIVVATGPLTAEPLAQDIAAMLGINRLSFYDAAAPLVYADSIDPEKSFRAARYGKGTADYINCPMSKDEYNAFYDALIRGECADVKDFDEKCVYEGCMPVEVMARRGADTLRFGPLKPVGLRHPETGESYYAVVQLRQDNTDGTLYNIVGFQTRLKFGEQKRIFGMIPALAHAEYARYGVMHRNTYLQSPGILTATFSVESALNPFDCPVFFAGQITGVEGYMESASSGLIAGLNAWASVTGNEPVLLPSDTMMGALASYVSTYGGGDFQPMGANFGILSSTRVSEIRGLRDKKQRKTLLSQHALKSLQQVIDARSDCFA
ncbi:MAG: methylenetetrahydrofolate--tRNA-(uracil(54)-C(5))-methyltransferase (FADH(2)-oxidizing) TrmFO [Clostridia bacterium]|nr:methylenetetrahydrofolate--tRNA-(uracil(54)-C(5))-methyltransferase (FADH(2)-oxidizing) TrmFO [Clostridia bacterium]